jgi:deoxyribonucleoside regulator
MAEIPYTDEQLILAARLYYIDGLSQAEIARMTRVSQAKVSRMLALARERGIVRITVPEYEPRNSALESELQNRLGLKHAVVIRAAMQRAEDLRHTLGYFAAPVVSRWIEPGSVVGIAGGRAMRALVEHMRPAGPASGVTVAQTMGNIDSSPGAYDALELGRTLARRWSAAFLTLNTPAILPDKETCKRLLGLDQIRGVLRALDGASLVFVGIGTLENSVFVERGVLKAREMEVLREAGAVGEIGGRFFDARGRECDTPLRHRVVSMPLDSLRKAPQVVAVVAGSDRTRGILAAVRGGLVKSLVIDENGASALLGEAR